jgi:hypothetical protein
MIMGKGMNNSKSMEASYVDRDYAHALFKLFLDAQHKRHTLAR